jgi:hypothetical protein
LRASGLALREQHREAIVQHNKPRHERHSRDCAPARAASQADKTIDKVLLTAEPC